MPPIDSVYTQPLTRTAERHEWLVTGSELDRRKDVRRQYPLRTGSSFRFKPDAQLSHRLLTTPAFNRHFLRAF